MRASSNIVAGRFFGGEIEEGTFHAKYPVGEFAPGDQTQRHDDSPSENSKPVDTAPSGKALDATGPEAEPGLRTVLR